MEESLCFCGRYSSPFSHAAIARTFYIICSRFQNICNAAFIFQQLNQAGKPGFPLIGAGIPGVVQRQKFFRPDGRISLKAEAVHESSIRMAKDNKDYKYFP